jgi:hypothetical protein
VITRAQRSLPDLNLFELGGVIWRIGNFKANIWNYSYNRGNAEGINDLEALLRSSEIKGLWATDASLASLPAGIAVAYLLARGRFWGRSVLDALVHLPLILPPVVTGYLLLLAFGRKGPIGAWLEAHFGLVFSFRWTGAALAAAVMGFPLMVRAIRLSIEAVDRRLEQAAGTLGAGPILTFLLVTLPPGAPLRDPETGAIIGQTPFMNSLLFIVMLCFLVPGIAFGSAVGKYKGPNDVIAAVVKTFAGLGVLIFTLLMISQFIAYFNYSNMPAVLATALAGWLGQAGIPAIPLLVGFVLVIVVLDFIMPGSLAKWAIFAPIFVPLFIQLGVPAQTLFAAYRVGDSPINTLTPLMVYFPVIVAFAQRYQKSAGVGSLVALMLPVAAVVLVAWLLFLILWFVLGIPLGPGYPVRL